MDKLKQTGQNLARVFNFRSGHLNAAHLWCCLLKVPNLKLKTQPKPLLGYLPIDIALPKLVDFIVLLAWVGQSTFYFCLMSMK
jgi:hypothetical protein